MRSTLAALLAGAALLAAGPIPADEKSDALLQKARQAVAAAKTLEADVVTTMKFGGRESVIQGTVRLMKPNYGEIKLKGPTGAPGQTVVSTGKEVFVALEAAKQYQKQPADPKGRNLSGATGPAGTMFLAPESVGAGGTTKYLGTQKVGDASYEVVEVTRGGGMQVEKLFFAAKGLLEGSETTYKGDQPDRTMVRSTWLKNIRLDTPLKADQFAYTPPEGFKLYEPPDFAAMLLPVGKEAPSFRLPQPAGAGELALEDTLKGKKAVLINFWFYNWGACREEFPHLQKIYDELKDKGLEIVAVNANDPEDRVVKYFRDSKFTFRVVMGGQGDKYTLGKAYGVQAYPTNYLVGTDGKILWRDVGFNESALREALGKAGVK